MDMDSAFAMMQGNDEALESLATRTKGIYYAKKVPESVKTLVESLGGKIVKSEDHIYYDIIFE